MNVELVTVNTHCLKCRAKDTVRVPATVARGWRLLPVNGKPARGVWRRGCPACVHAPPMGPRPAHLRLVASP